MNKLMRMCLDHVAVRKKKCRKMTARNAHFSDTILKKRHQQYFLEYVRRKLKTKRSITLEDLNTAKEANIGCDIKKADEVKRTLKSIYAFIEADINRETETRAEFLEELATKYATENNMSKSKAITELLKHEQLRDTFRHMASKIKDMKRTQLKKIWKETLTSDGLKKRIEIHDEEEMAAAILKRNHGHLRQAKNTPFARGWLGATLKWDGTGNAAEEIVRGTYRTPPYMDPWVVQYIKKYGSWKTRNS